MTAVATVLEVASRLKPTAYRSPPIIEAPDVPRLARLRDRLANWGRWCNGIGMCLADGYGAGLNEWDSGDPMVRDEGWGEPSVPAEVALPFNPKDAREIETAIRIMAKDKPGHVSTLTLCYVHERHVDAGSRVPAELYLLGMLDKM